LIAETKEDAMTAPILSEQMKRQPLTDQQKDDLFLAAQIPVALIALGALYFLS